MTVALPLPGVAAPIVGAPGATGGPAAGVALLEAADATPEPIAFLAVTVKVYAVPLVRLLTVMGLDARVAVLLPGVEVTV